MDTANTLDDEYSENRAPASKVKQCATRHIVDVNGLRNKEKYFPDGILYTDFFKFLDKHLRPRTYFEIGTERGRSVRAFDCAAVCVDPQFKLEADVLAGRSQIHFYQLPSDTFFAQHNLKNLFENGPDLCFLDGMHRCEYLLRDFINTEQLCHDRSIIFLHDCIPAFPRMTLRTHQIGDPSEGPFQYAWTGDVWKVVPILKKFRPDLKVFLLDCAPTGLVAITNLNPTSTELSSQYQTALEEMRQLDIESFTMSRLLDQAPLLSSKSLVESPEDLTLYFNNW